MEVLEERHLGRKMIPSDPEFVHPKRREKLQFSRRKLEGHSQEALRVYINLREAKVLPGISSFVAALKVCSSSRDLVTGMKIHRDAVECRAQECIFVANTLVNMYSRCGRLSEARQVFDAIRFRSLVSWNSIILGHSDGGEARSALQFFGRMQNEGFKPDSRTFVSVFKALASLGRSERRNAAGWLITGRVLHTQAAEGGHESNNFVANTLVDMYAKLGSMMEARAVFERIQQHSLVSWNALITGYAEAEQGRTALELFRRMQDLGFEPSDLTFTAAFKACAICALKEQDRTLCLEEGRQIRQQVGKSDDELDGFLASTLVDFFTKCGSLGEAKRVFDSMRSRDLVSWSTLVMGYAENGKGEEALELFLRMQDEGFQADGQAFLGAVKACSAINGSVAGKKCWWRLENGREIHTQIIKSGFEDDLFLVTALIDMYAKQGSLVEAQAVFDRMKARSSTVSLWNSILQAYADCGEGDLTFRLFQRMEEEGVLPDGRTYTALFKACTTSGLKREKLLWSERGAALQIRADKEGIFESDVYAANAVLDMFVKCGNLVEGRKAFDKMQNRTVVSWSTLILGHADAGDFDQALKLFEDMKQSGIRPNSRTYVALFKACGASAHAVSERGGERDELKQQFLEKGRGFHQQFAGSRMEMDVFVANSLIDMYAKCGSMVEARLVFDDERVVKKDCVLWSSIISGYVENEDQELAKRLFQRMEDEGIEADTGIYAAFLKACSSLADAEGGRGIHGKLCCKGVENDFVLATCLMDLYGKCGRVRKAQLVFDGVEIKDVVAWNALINGYAQQANISKVFELFGSMKQEEVEPSSITYLSVLSLCSHSGLINKGIEVFQGMSRPGVEHYSCMIDLFCRANKVEDGIGMLIGLPVDQTTNLRIWTTLLNAAQKSGNPKLAKIAFESSLKTGNTDAASAFVLMSKHLLS